jgi:HEAT repeat protein
MRGTKFLLPGLVVLLLVAAPASSQDDPVLARQVERLIAGLSADEFETRQESGDRLEALGEVALPWLEAAAASEDPEVARQARRLIRGIRQRHSDDLLTSLHTQNNAFRTTDEFHRLVARGRELIPALLAILAEEDGRGTTYSYYRFRNAYWVLAELVTFDDFDLLVSLLRSSNVQHRILVEPILRSFDQEQVITRILTILTDPQADPQVRAHLVEMSINTSFSGNDPRLETAALSMLEDEREAVRSSALRYLGIRRNPEGLPKIIALCRDESIAVRTAALQALRSYRDPEALVPLRASLLDPAPEVRSAGIETLRSNGGPDLAPAVKPFLSDPDPRVRSSAAQFLARFGDRSALPVLLESLKLRDEEFLSRALNSLLDAIGGIGDETALPPLFDLLDDEDQFDLIRTYRYRILQAIVQVGGVEVLPRVEPWLTRADLQNASIVLDEIARLDSDQVVPILMSALEKGDTRMRTSAIRGLTARNHREAVELIAKALTEETDAWLLSEATKALTTFGYEPAVPIIRTYLDGDLEDMSRLSLHYAAIRAMMRFHVPEAAPRIAQMAAASQNIRSIGVDALASLGNRQVADTLKAIHADESNDGIRYRIEVALARLGAPGMLEARLPSLGDAASSSRASAYLALGRIADARADLDRLLESSPANGSILYDLACVDACDGRPDAAIEGLKRAMSLRTLSKDQILTDPDLRAIRDDPRLWEVLEKAR